MRTVVTYLDKEKNRTTKENAWTVVTQVFQDSATPLRTVSSAGEAQIRALHGNGDRPSLCLREETSGKTVRFSKTLLRVGRDASCDLVFDQKEDKKKIDKVHAVFELRQGVWHVMDQSRSGVWINGNRIAANTPTAVHPGDRVELGQRRTLRID